MPTPAQIDEQIQLERDAIAQGLKKLHKNTRDLEGKDYASATVYGAASIDTLQKLHSANERNETQKEVKKMDVESKERLNIADNQTRILLSRDDIMKALVDKDDDVIDV